MHSAKHRAMITEVTLHSPICKENVASVEKTAVFVAGDVAVGVVVIDAGFVGVVVVVVVVVDVVVVGVVVVDVVVVDIFGVVVIDVVVVGMLLMENNLDHDLGGFHCSCNS